MLQTHDTRTLQASGTWITLSEAAQFAARIGGVDERIAALMDADTWALEAGRKIDCPDWPKDAEAQIRRAGELLKTLSAVLGAGKVAGEGSLGRPGAAPPVARISELEWATHYVHFWKNELQPIKTNQPRIVDVWVRTEDVRRELEKELAARREVKPIVDLRAVIRDAARANGGDLTQVSAYNIAREAGATESREIIRQTVRETVGSHRPGRRGSRKNRAVAPA